MCESFSRNSLYWGEEKQSILNDFNIAVFGLGGVGGYCVEMLARAGVGELTLVDFDTVSKSNINRQIIALNSTIGQNKTDLFVKRLKDINPEIKLNVVSDFYTDKLEETVFSAKVDFVADAIDTMRSKVSLLEFVYKKQIPVISSMGAGNRVNPTKLYISDISEIHDKKASFVSNVLYQLNKRGITSGITVVTSDEKPFVQEKISEVENVKTNAGEEIEFTKIIPSSTPFVASTAGIYMASYIVRTLLDL
ncbi:MAG: tRNA threonylcarbamoyladenosine dehydratase [Candidatus Gastranaerophilales bacterium]|nr:tRNA threonylcarbamoyladenosine dehydratase [Candidatus Gastranaerophilales bacterium]